jgi:hypothetical protein
VWEKKGASSGYPFERVSKGGKSKPPSTSVFELACGFAASPRMSMSPPHRIIYHVAHSSEWPSPVKGIALTLERLLPTYIYTGHPFVSASDVRARLGLKARAWAGLQRAWG